MSGKNPVDNTMVLFCINLQKSTFKIKRNPKKDLKVKLCKETIQISPDQGLRKVGWEVQMIFIA